MSDTGVVKDIVNYTPGDTLTVAAAAIDTVLVVKNASDFDDEFEEDRYLIVGGETTPRQYIDVEKDDDASQQTVTLAGPVGGAGLQVDLPVEMWDPSVGETGSPAVVFKALVALHGRPDSSPVPVFIDHELVPLTDVYGLKGATVSLVEDSDGDWWIDRVLGRQAVMEATFLAPGSAPWVPDGVPPATASTVTPQPVPGALAYRWTEVPNADPVTYRLHVRAGSTPATDGTYEVASGVAVTAALVRKLADGTVVDSTGAVTYYAIVSVEDADGRGPDSSAVTSAPAQVQSGELAIDAVTTAHLTATDAFIGALQVVDFSTITMTAPTIQSEATENRGIKLAYDPDGGVYFRVWDSAGRKFFDLTPNGGVAILDGEATLTELTVKNGSSLGGATDIGAAGVLTLRSGAVAPTNKPTVGSTYDSVTFTQDGNWGSRRGWAWDGTNYFTANQATRKIEKWNTSGTLVASSSQWSGSQFVPTSAAIGGSNLYVGMFDTVSPNFYLFVYDRTSLVFAGLAWFPDYNVGGKIPAVGYDATAGASNPILIAQARTSGTVRIHRGTTATDFVTGSTLDTFTLDVNLASVLYAQDVAGVGGFDFTAGGPSRYMLASQTGPTLAVANGSTGAQRAADQFALGVTDKVGVAWNGTAFASMDRSGVLRTYTTLDKEVDQTNASTTKWVSDSYYRATGTGPPAAPWETSQSPKAKVVQFPKRSKMTVTGPALPASPGSNDPNQIQVYVGSGSSEPADSAMWRQTTPSTGVSTATYSTLTTSGSAHPNAGTAFPSSGPSALQSDAVATDTLPVTQFKSDGTGRALKLTQAGEWSTGAFVGTGAANVKTQAVTFDPAFAATPVVVVVSGDDTNVRIVWATNVTASGCTLNAYRATGTGGITVGWVATAKTQ